MVGSLLARAAGQLGNPGSLRQGNIIVRDYRNLVQSEPRPRMELNLS
jgi:hypothetical protein